MFDYDYDYKEKPKKKKKHDKEESSHSKAKPLRNFKIIDDDIDINTLNPSEEAEVLVDLLDPEGPTIADASDYIPQEVKKIDVLKDNKWIKLDLTEDINGELVVSMKNEEINSTANLFRKRGGEKATNKQTDDEDSDLDTIPRKRVDQDGDLSPVRRKKSEEDEVDVTKVRVRKMTKEEEMKKTKKEEKLAKYMEWGKGLVQKKERDDKLKSDIYEADKPLARYKDDKDLDRLLREQEREDDPMLEYFKKNDPTYERNRAKYKGPPPPPNRYNILPGPRWDGVDRSNGFEKKFYESIMAKKAREEEAYKWSIEDM